MSLGGSKIGAAGGGVESELSAEPLSVEEGL